MATEPLVTILIPNYKTLEITQLCLRLIRKHTNPELARVVVIDNHSQDESLNYLRSLKWISLIERTPASDDTPPLAHSRALDLALNTVSTPYVLSMHTDTIVKDNQWLNFLLKQIIDSPQVASVGSWKLESKPWYKRWAKIVEQRIQLFWYRLIHKKKHAIQGVGENYYYLRSHCALYRTDLLRQHRLTFSAENESAGKVIHRKLQELGYQTIFLPSETLGKYVDHLNHATTALNPELGSRQKSIDKGTKRIKKALAQLQSDKILADISLDL